MIVAILAGGASRRMGTDKAALEVEGETLLARTIRIAREAGATRALVVGRVGGDVDAEFVPDDPERIGQGPIAGLLAALDAAQGEVLLLACDMPGLTPEALRWLWDAARSRGEAFPDGLGAVGDDDRIEPLFSVYAPGCRGLVDAGDRSLVGLIGRGRFARIAVPAAHRPSLDNVNTPEELAAFWAKKGGMKRRILAIGALLLAVCGTVRAEEPVRIPTPRGMARKVAVLPTWYETARDDARRRALSERIEQELRVGLVRSGDEALLVKAEAELAGAPESASLAHMGRRIGADRVAVAAVEVVARDRVRVRVWLVDVAEGRALLAGVVGERDASLLPRPNLAPDRMREVYARHQPLRPQALAFSPLTPERQRALLAETVREIVGDFWRREATVTAAARTR